MKWPFHIYFPDASFNHQTETDRQRGGSNLNPDTGNILLLLGSILSHTNTIHGLIEALFGVMGKV